MHAHLLPVTTHSRPSCRKGTLLVGANMTYKSSLRQYFAKRSTSYEADNQFHPRLARKLVDLAALNPGDAVLDVATGTGYVAAIALERVGSTGTVMGIDISGDMLRQARDKLDAFSAGFVLLEADIEQLDFAGPHFDVILCSASLPFLTDVPAFLTKSRRWLKKGGRLAFNTPQEPYSPTKPLLFATYRQYGIPAVNSGPIIGSSAAIRQTLAAAGYTSVKVEADVGERSLQPISDAAGYAAQQWQGMMSMPLATFSAVEQDDVQEARKEFIRAAAALVEQQLTPERLLDTTLTTLWTVAS